MNERAKTHHVRETAGSRPIRMQELVGADLLSLLGHDIQVGQHCVAFAESNGAPPLLHLRINGEYHQPTGDDWRNMSIAWAQLRETQAMNDMTRLVTLRVERLRQQQGDDYAIVLRCPGYTVKLRESHIVEAVDTLLRNRTFTCLQTEVNGENRITFIDFAQRANTE